jgi:hypothetical protein
VAVVIPVAVAVVIPVAVAVVVETGNHCNCSNDTNNQSPQLRMKGQVYCPAQLLQRVEKLVMLVYETYKII